MKTPWLAVGLIIGCCGCGEAVDRTNDSTAPHGKELLVTVQWPEDRRVIQMPFQLVDELPVVRCRLNGKEAVLYVDTGSQPICLYEDRLAGFGLKVTSEEDWPRYTPGGHLKRTRFCDRFTLDFPGGLSMEVSGAACMPGEGRSPEHDVDGILGVKILRALKATIDFDSNQVTLAVKAAPSKNGPATGNPLLRSETNQPSGAAGSPR